MKYRLKIRQESCNEPINELELFMIQGEYGCIKVKATNHIGTKTEFVIMPNGTWYSRAINGYLKHEA